MTVPSSPPLAAIRWLHTRPLLFALAAAVVFPAIGICGDYFLSDCHGAEPPSVRLRHLAEKHGVDADRSISPEEARSTLDRLAARHNVTLPDRSVSPAAPPSTAHRSQYRVEDHIPDLSVEDGFRKNPVGKEEEALPAAGAPPSLTFEDGGYQGRPEDDTPEMKAKIRRFMEMPPLPAGFIPQTIPEGGAPGTLTDESANWPAPPPGMWSDKPGFVTPDEYRKYKAWLKTQGFDLKN